MGIGAPSASKMVQSVPANLGLGLEEVSCRFSAQ